MKKNIKYVVIAVVLVALAVFVVTYYYRIRKKAALSNYEDNSDETEVQALLDTDLKNGYPITAREVVKLYCRISKAFYNEKMSDDEFRQLIGLMRGLYDEKLLSQNTEEENIESMEDAVTAYENDKMTITDYTVQDVDDIVEYVDKNDEKIANVVVEYFISKGGKISSTYQKYYLIQSDADQWKILGWESADEEDMKRSEVEKLLEKDFENDYPVTVSGVADYYCRITKAYYNETMDDDEFENMVKQMRQLFDDELLSANPLDSQIASLKTEINDMKTAGTAISEYAVPDESEVTAYTQDGKNMASEDIEFIFTTKGVLSTSNETLTFRKDSSGKWKIVKWELSEKQ